MPFVVMVYASTPDQARAIRDRYSAGDAGRVVGVYEWPKSSTPTCERPLSCRAGSAYTRHPVRGFMVHACGRRVASWKVSIGRTLFDMLGTNMLKRSRTPSAFRNPEGWGS